MERPSIPELIERITGDALAASHELATLTRAQKDAALLRIAAALEDADQQSAVLAANALDLAAAVENDLSPAMQDRLRLTPARMDGIAAGVRQIAALPDPVGAVLETTTHPQGFTIAKRRVPIGVIGIVYESRPNVTVDCAALCLKSGNATILRGGKEAIHSNGALANLIATALMETGLSRNAVQLIPVADRSALLHLLHADSTVHCLIPRGGEGLIRFVAENARMPVIKHYKGICNIYLDAEADAELALPIVVNAKCQRPGVCNAAENLVVHQSLLTTVLPEVARALLAKGVELRADGAAATALAEAHIATVPATEEDFATEYLDNIISIKTVASLEEAVAIIHRYGSGHSDAIVTRNAHTAGQFQTKVDSAAVYWNVSTRFTDGFEFGMGAEIGISTDKLHARGPMGLNELCSYKYIISGNGQIRT